MNRTAAVLIVEGGPNNESMIPLHRGTNTMGRQFGNDIVDTETGVSRLHAEIDERSSGYYLRDRSTNGTFVNDSRIPAGDFFLTDGDRIRLGPSQVTFVFRSDTAGTMQITLP